MDYRAIFVACILLSRGKTSDKALILWRVFDPESKGLLSRSDSKAMFTVLCKAALDVFAESAA